MDAKREKKETLNLQSRWEHGSVFVREKMKGVKYGENEGHVTCRGMGKSGREEIVALMSYGKPCEKGGGTEAEARIFWGKESRGSLWISTLAEGSERCSAGREREN